MAKTISLGEAGSMLRQALEDSEKASKQAVFKGIKQSVPAMKEQSEQVAKGYDRHSIEHIIGKRVAKGWGFQKAEDTAVIGNTDRDAHRFETGSRGGIEIAPTGQLDAASDPGGIIEENITKELEKI